MDTPPGTQQTPETGPQQADSQTSPAARVSASKPASRVNRRIDQPQEVGAPVQLPAFLELQKLMNAIADEEVDFAEFCVALRDVPQVKSMIFRDARSIVAGRVNRIENLKHAVAMLGLNKVRAILEHLAEPYEEYRKIEQGQQADDGVARVPA